MTNEQFNKPSESIIDFKSQVAKAIHSLNSRVGQLESLPQGSIEVKGTTGDFVAADTDSWDGRMVLNTVDNNLKILENLTWRTITSW